MELSKFIIFLFVLAISSLTYGTKLPEFITKQNSSVLRFISNDGKFTYYQKQEGDLVLSTNFSVSTAVKGESRTNYSLTSTSNKKGILASANKTFHNLYSLKKNHDIYFIKYGTTNSVKIGKGTSPRLHEKDTLTSFYNPHTKIITLKKNKTSEILTQIKIHAKTNPFFRPQVSLINSQNIIYTDINSKGVQAILSNDRVSKKTRVLLKMENPLYKIQLCENNEYIFLGEFPLINNSGSSIISKIDKKNFDISKKEIVYTSKRKDIGNILCDYQKDKMAFIKSYQNNESELVELDLKSKKITILTDLKYTNSAISLDSRIIVPYFGKNYLVKGKNNSLIIDQLSKEK